MGDAANLLHKENNGLLWNNELTWKWVIDWTPSHLHKVEVFDWQLQKHLMRNFGWCWRFLQETPTVPSQTCLPKCLLTSCAVWPQDSQAVPAGEVIKFYIYMTFINSLFKLFLYVAKIINSNGLCVCWSIHMGL